MTGRGEHQLQTNTYQLLIEVIGEKSYIRSFPPQTASDTMEKNPQGLLKRNDYPFGDRHPQP